MIEPKRNLIRVVEAAYQIGIDQQQWLEQLVEVFSSMHGAECGLMVYLYDASEPEQGARIHDYALCGLSEDFARGAILHNAHSPADDVRRVYHSGVRCATVSEILASQDILPVDHPSFGQYRDYYPDSRDAWGLSASNPGGRGVGIAAPLEQVSSMPEGMRELWGLVGVHLATAHRLRRASQEVVGADEEAEAVLEPDGNLLHAEGPATDADSRAVLRDAVRRIDLARSNKLRDEPEAALPLWKGMVEGRWSLVEREDSDGRRLLMAHPNQPRFDAPEALTQRERQIVAYAAQGDSDERISYTLGLDEDTIESLMISAMEKLGVWTRAELMRVGRKLHEDDSSGD